MSRIPAGVRYKSVFDNILSDSQGGIAWPQTPGTPTNAHTMKSMTQDMLHNNIMKNEDTLYEESAARATSRGPGGASFIKDMTESEPRPTPHLVQVGDEQDRAGMAELLETENWLANNGPEAIPTVIYLNISFESINGGLPIMGPVSMPVKKHMALDEFWKTLQHGNGKRMQQAGIRSPPELFIFQCSSNKQPAYGHGPANQDFEARCAPNKAHEPDRIYQDFVAFCIREGRSKAVEVYQQTKARAREVRYLRTKAARYDAHGRKRDIPNATRPAEVPVYANVQVFFP